jgi:hypothetical protein
MKQTSTLTRRLAANQEHAAYRKGQMAQAGFLYTLYVGQPKMAVDVTCSSIVARYFPGATIRSAVGLWQGETEFCKTVEIVATRADLQNIVSLAGDLRHVYGQESVLVTWTSCSSLLVTA